MEKNNLIYLYWLLPMITVLIVICTLILVLIWSNKESIVNQPRDYNLYTRDMSGSSYIHSEVTPQGDLWIYNSEDKKIYYMENPKNNDGKISVIEKVLINNQ